MCMNNRTLFRVQSFICLSCYFKGLKWFPLSINNPYSDIEHLFFSFSWQHHTGGSQHLTGHRRGDREQHRRDGWRGVEASHLLAAPPRGHRHPLQGPVDASEGAAILPHPDPEAPADPLSDFRGGTSRWRHNCC